MSKERLWIVSDDEQLRARIQLSLQRSNREVDGFGFSSGGHTPKPDEVPNLVIVDLRDAAQDELALATLGHHAGRPHSRVLAVVNDAAEGHMAMSAGADEIVLLPLDPEELELRVTLQLELVRQFSDHERREHDMQVVLELVQLLAGASDVREALVVWVERIAEMARADRVSIVITRPGIRKAFVIASSDDSRVENLPISLDAHPEIDECVSHQAPVFVGDAHSDSRFGKHQASHSFEFRSMLVVPLRDDAVAQAQGVLFVRARKPGALDIGLLPLLQTLGFVAGVGIRNARTMQSLRAETQHSAEAREQAERRLQRFRPYAEFFKNSADGMAVMEPSGKLLYANPLAKRMAGRSTKLEGANVLDFIEPGDRERARSIAKGFRSGVYPKNVDFSLSSPRGPITLSVNFSETLSGAGAVLLTFRDVTKERRTEQELIEMKDFLERVIDSSVDAIVSSDIAGNVLIFNHAASRIFGYAPEDVVGKMNVERLYPPGGARDVMRDIRGANHGGRGRLQQRQVDMLDSAGRLVRVEISAALIYKHGTPVGSVGIFTDIREQLRMQASLREAQEKIREHERNTAVAQLAGATAHELNQPLTSVITHAEWLRHRAKGDQKLVQATDVLIEQAERMAEIVRQIGKITRYETRTYVGSSQILDIEKASEIPNADEESTPVTELGSVPRSRGVQRGS